VSESSVRTPDVGVVRSRLVWVDVAKAIAIGLVVLHHAVVFANAAGWLPPSVVRLNAQLGTFRMPLFFLASGLFAAGALGRPWRTVLRRRVVLFVHLYLLWTLLRFGLFQVVPDVRANGRDGDLGAVLWSPLLPGTGLWFIYALALYSVVAKVLLPVPPPVQLAAAAVVSAVVGSGLLDVGNFAWRNMAMYFVFFLLGMHGRAQVERFAQRAGAPLTVGLGVASVLAVAVVDRAGLRQVPFVWLLVSCAAVLFGVALSVQLARIPVLASHLSWLGERTLPVYLLHVPVVALLVALLESLLDPGRELGTALVAVTALVAAATSLVAYSPLQRAFPWLFAVPRVGAPARR
jgi:uncharacterized membrane protein YcfT